MGKGLGGGGHPPLDPLPSREGKRLLGRPFSQVLLEPDTIKLKAGSQRLKTYGS